MAEFEYEMDKAGVMEICRSPEVQAELGRLAKSVEGKANRQARADEKAFTIMGEHLSGKRFETAPYCSRVKVLGKTAIASVATTTKVALLYELTTGTLDSFNH